MPSGERSFCSGYLLVRICSRFSAVFSMYWPSDLMPSWSATRAAFLAAVSALPPSLAAPRAAMNASNRAMMSARGGVGFRKIVPGQRGDDSVDGGVDVTV